jgi:hypothetical protein
MPSKPQKEVTVKAALEANEFKSAGYSGLHGTILLYRRGPNERAKIMANGSWEYIKDHIQSIPVLGTCAEELTKLIKQDTVKP